MLLKITKKTIQFRRKDIRQNQTELEVVDVVKYPQHKIR